MVEGKKWSKMRKNSVTLHISGIIHHMIFIYGTHVQNDTSRIFLFFQTFDFLGYRGVKGQKIAQNDKKLCLLYLISQLRDHTSYDYHLWSTSVK